ncbi:DUF4091 domain-containing protein [Acutalibacter sp. 1XD8-33]|uniref:DUF4091 domain-containing protein n=1 Tax=Acutalibacter sp. 1XD8-33 TaxID=2320081 RepID=UPI000EA16CE1|nr:DUF4091 domain-containing protein [Acutalibacter sp. 1XD8-33]RKJ40728.1 DUF4091 domain-containing protein [Acutalibacter sp. 1XD8-33]
MKFAYQIVSGMCKVFPGGETLRELRPPRLSGLKGETLSFQIAYCWEEWSRAWGGVQVESPLPVRVRTVELVPCQYPCHMVRDEGYLAVQPGLYPDLLQELPPQGFPLISGQWRSLWVDVEPGGNAAPGEYPVRVKLETGGEALCQVEFPCEVLDLPLPKLPIPHTEWFHSDCLANYYQVEVFSERYWEIVAEFVRTAARRKCNMLLTPVFTPPLDTAVGGERRTVQLVDVEVRPEGYAFCFEKFRRWVRMALSCGMEYLEISHLFSQWGAAHAPKILAVKDGRLQRIFGWDTDAGGEEYGEFLRQFLRALKPELEALGVSPKTYFHISDEPSMAQIESYRKAGEVVEEELRGYAMLDALSDYAFYQEGLVQQPVCALDHIGPFLENPPERLWGYYCTGQYKDVPNRFIVQPGSRTRILGALLYKHQLSGFLHWGYNFYNSQNSLYPIDPYKVTDADGAFPSGDPFLVYPGADGRPEESQRLMLMDQAMSDYCALTVLEGLAGREKALALLGEPLAFTEYPGEEGVLSLRERVNEAIKEALS